jgi:hypothetical protein
MKTLRIFDIQWDTDGEDYKALGLPSEHTALVENDFDPMEQASDLLSDKFGYCVLGCNFAVVSTITSDNLLVQACNDLIDFLIDNPDYPNRQQRAEYLDMLNRLRTDVDQA